jgi:hypothetical protein
LRFGAARHVQRWASHNLPFRLHRYVTFDSLCLAKESLDESELADVIFKAAPLSQLPCTDSLAYWQNPSTHVKKRLRDLLFAIESRTTSSDLTERTLTELNCMVDKLKNEAKQKRTEKSKSSANAKVLALENEARAYSTYDSFPFEELRETLRSNAR